MTSMEIVSILPVTSEVVEIIGVKQEIFPRPVDRLRWNGLSDSGEHECALPGGADQPEILNQFLQGLIMAKYLQCSECGKLAFYYDDYVGTEKPFYKRFMRYPEGETKHEPPRCFSCGGVPRLIHENIKEEKAAAKH